MADQTPEKPTGEPRWDAVLARLEAKAAEEEARKAAEGEIESQSGPESAQSDSPRGKGRVESADAAEDASGSSKVVGDAVVGNEGKAEEEGVRAVTRNDPILPALRVTSVLEPRAREAGRLAFGGLVEGREDLAETQLPLFDRGQEGPRVAMLELADARGGPIMARGRGAPLDLRLFVAACVMTPLTVREAQEPLVTTVRELRDFCFRTGGRSAGTGRRSGARWYGCGTTRFRGWWERRREGGGRSRSASHRGSTRSWTTR